MHSSVGFAVAGQPYRLPLTVATRIGDYCDVYLTHDSMSVRKAHNSGRNHLRNVLEYYQRMRDPRGFIKDISSQNEDRDRTGTSSIGHRFDHVVVRR